MTSWHRSEAEKSLQRLTPNDIKSSNQGKPGGGNRHTDTAVVDESRSAMVDRVATYKFDKYSGSCGSMVLNSLQ